MPSTKILALVAVAAPLLAPPTHVVVACMRPSVSTQVLTRMVAVADPLPAPPALTSMSDPQDTATSQEQIVDHHQDGLMTGEGQCHSGRKACGGILCCSFASAYSAWHWKMPDCGQYL